MVISNELMGLKWKKQALLMNLSDRGRYLHVHTSFMKNVEIIWIEKMTFLENKTQIVQHILKLH